MRDSGRLTVVSRPDARASLGDLAQIALPSLSKPVTGHRRTYPRKTAEALPHPVSAGARRQEKQHAMRPPNGLTRTLTLLMTGSFLTLGLLFAGRSVAAQDVGNAPHPAHIHSGSCTELGDVVYPLTDVSAGSTSMTGSPTSAMMGSPVAGMAEATPTTEMAMGTPAGTPAGPFGVVIETSDTTVEAALTDLTAGGYAINVHESAENIGNYIACG